MSRLIVTIAAGDSIDYGDLTVPRFYTYAKKCGADVLVLTRPVFGQVVDATAGQPGNPSWWKIPLILWFASQNLYSHLAYVDVDVVISDAAPSIFEGVSGMAMCRDMHDEREWPQWQEWARTHYPERPFELQPEGYFNAGVWVCDKAAADRMAEVIAAHPDFHSRWMEQDFLQFAARAADCLTELPVAFNHPVPFLSRDLGAGYFYHLCGLSQERKREWIIKIESAEFMGETCV